MSRIIDSKEESRYAFMAKLLNGISGIFGVIIFANFLGVERVGTYYILTSLVFISRSPAMGIGIGVEHKIGYHNDNPTKQGIFATTGIISVAIISIIVCIIGLIAYFLLPEIGFIYISNAILLFLILQIIFNSLNVISKRIYSGMGRPANTLFIATIQGFLQTIIQVILLVGFNLGIPGLLLGSVIAAILSILYIWIVKKPLQPKKPNKKAFLKLYKFSKWSGTSNTIRSIYKRTPILILAIILSPAIVGIYESALRIVDGTRYVSESIRRVIMISTSQKTDNKNEIIKDLNNLGGYASILTIPLFFGSIIIGVELLDFLYNDPSFLRGSIVLIAGAIFYTIFNHNDIVSGFTNGIGEPSAVAKSTILAFICLITVGTGLTYVLKLRGLLIILIISELIRFIYLYEFNHQIKNITYKPKHIFEQLASGICMIIILYPLKIATNSMYNSLQVFVILTVGGFTYFTVLYILDKNVRKYINKITPLLS